MGESAESLFRRGMISSKAWKKPGILSRTRVERAKEEKFHGKQGLKDQGGPRDYGAIDEGHINDKRTQKMGPKPSKGGAVNKYGQVSVGEINDSDEQKPNNPREGSTIKKKAKLGAPSRITSSSTAPAQKSGAQSGNYGASNSRP
jgi:hypothetical protein